MKKHFKFSFTMVSILISSIFYINIGICLISQTNDITVEFEEIGQIDTPGMARHIVIKDDIAFITDMGSLTSTYGGFLIFNVSNPSNPIQLSHFFDEGRAHELVIENDIAFIADNTGGLEIFNISVLTNPIKINEYPGVINGVYKIGDLIYLSDYYEGLIIMDISNLSQPFEIARYPEIYHPNLNLIKSDLAFIGVDSGLKIYDISNPENITELASFSYDFHVYDLQIVEEYAYMACARSIFEPGEGIKIYNCSNPIELTPISTYYDGGRSVNLHISENYMIVGDYNDGLEIIDISDPHNPREIGQYYDGGNATDFQVINDLIYVADGVDGLEIIRFTISNRTTSNQTTSALSYFFIASTLILLCYKRVVKKRKQKRILF